MDQCLFDEIVLFVLETISSEDYLREQVGINRASPVTDWPTFIKQMTKQQIEPGIYPRMIGDDAHYYAVRCERTADPNVCIKRIGNGYKSLGSIDKKYSVGLNAQPDHSHGLCQTFALMYYFFEEKRLGKGRRHWFNNVIVGFEFLLELIYADYDNREMCWTVESMIENMSTPSEECKKIPHSKRAKNLREIAAKVAKASRSSHKLICLTDLIKVILEHRETNLRVWFD